MKNIFKPFKNIYDFLAKNELILPLSVIGIFFSIAAIFIALVYTWHNHDIKTHNDSYYLVPDPIAAKEGETQWLQLPYAEVQHTRSNGHDIVSFSIDGVKYKSTLYIFADTSEQ